MTREEAIEILGKRKRYCKVIADHANETVKADELREVEALDMAITTLHAPTREMVERMRGEWIHDGPKFEGGTDWYHCSKCGAKETGVYVKYNFCFDSEMLNYRLF